MAISPPESSASRRREQVLGALGATPIVIEELAESLGLKTSTVRSDLEVLRALGQAARTALPREGRGRPRWGYAAAVPQANPYETLARALAHQMAGDPSTAGGSSEQLAEEWLSRLPRLEPVDTPDGAVAQAAESLQSLGFGVQVNPRGTEITMTGCPYADLVSDFPKICEIHAALLRGVLAESGQGVDVDHIDVWARPGMCVASLARPDLQPERTITAHDLNHLTPGGESA